MDVAILYSGGKDSTYAIHEVLKKGWNIKYLISIKPTRTDCYLFHYATIEHTKTLARILGYKHVYETCNVADPKKEAEIVKKIVEKSPVDAIVLGGTGLQQTQIKSIQEVLSHLKVGAFAMHDSLDHDGLVRQMIEDGYRIIITQIAAEGLTEEWLGKEITKENAEKLFNLSRKYGFHCGGEGGHFDSLVIDGPIFKRSLEILSAERIMESECVGHLILKKIRVKTKPIEHSKKIYNSQCTLTKD